MKIIHKQLLEYASEVMMIKWASPCELSKPAFILVI